jgi:hypothetical protein
MRKYYPINKVKNLAQIPMNRIWRHNNFGAHSELHTLWTNQPTQKHTTMASMTRPLLLRRLQETCGRNDPPLVHWNQSSKMRCSLKYVMIKETIDLYRTLECSLGARVSVANLFNDKMVQMRGKNSVYVYKFEGEFLKTPVIFLFFNKVPDSVALYTGNYVEIPALHQQSTST